MSDKSLDEQSKAAAKLAADKERFDRATNVVQGIMRALVALLLALVVAHFVIKYW